MPCVRLLCFVKVAATTLGAQQGPATHRDPVPAGECIPRGPLRPRLSRPAAVRQVSVLRDNDNVAVYWVVIFPTAQLHYLVPLIELKFEGYYIDYSMCFLLVHIRLIQRSKVEGDICSEILALMEFTRQQIHSRNAKPVRVASPNIRSIA